MAEEKTLEEILADIRRELEEDRAFLQISLLDPDPDIRAAEEARVQNVLELSEMMEDIITHLLHEEPVSDEEVMENAGEEIRKFEENLVEKCEEIEKACAVYEKEAKEEAEDEKEEKSHRKGSYVEYGTHTVGRADHRDNIEGDWILNAQGEEEIEEEKRKKKKKKKGKKDKKSKKKDKKSKKKK